MTTSFPRSLTVALASLLLLTAFLTQPLLAANQAVMTVGGKKTVFANIIAVPGDSYGEKRTIVLATMQKLPADALAKVRDKDAEDNNDPEIRQNYLKAVFDEQGEIRCCVGRGPNTSFTTRSPEMKAELKLVDNRAKGLVTLVERGDFPKNINLSFDVPYGVTAAPEKPAAPPGPVKPTVTGTFLGNGKPARLAYITIFPTEPFNAEEAVLILFSEKDHSKKKNPWIAASFGDFGNALILRCHLTGGIFGCEVSHVAHEKRGFSSIGSINMVEFDTAGGNLRGQVSTDGEQEFFGETWEVDLQFAAPLPAETLKGLAKTDAPAKPADTPAPSVPTEKPAQPKPSVPKLSVYDVVLPKGATDTQYKQLVEQFTFKCPAKVPAAATEMTSSLQAKGWQKEGSDLVTPKSAILKRKRGAATLTIMIKPEGAGSRFTIFTEGLNWEKRGGDAKESPPADPDDLDIDAEINKALDEIRKIKIDF
ncbi:MAG: hypothetical protein KF708_16080 [Pirellulales bacterium]|nr:hypothetical protein [Pirellulales bacterium]